MVNQIMITKWAKLPLLIPQETSRLEQAIMRCTAWATSSVIVLVFLSQSTLLDAFFSVVSQIRWCAVDKSRYTRGRQLLPYHEAVESPRCRHHQEENDDGRYRISPRMRSKHVGLMRNVRRARTPVVRCVGRRRPLVTALPRMSSDDIGGGGGVINPLRRDDSERAKISSLISALASTPMDQWRPDVLQDHLPILLQGGLFRQTMTERLANARSRKDREDLTRVDAFLTGYLGKEKRRSSRAKVSQILGAASVGPAELDQCIKTFGSEDQLDDDLRDYLETLVATEENKFGDSLLLQVLRTVRDRVEAEIKIGSRPEIRKLAQALNFDDPKERRKYLESAFTKLEDLDDFVNFVQEGIDFLGDDMSFAIKTSMPSDNLGKMKAIHAEVSAIRRRYYK